MYIRNKFKMKINFKLRNYFVKIVICLQGGGVVL